MSRFWKFIIRHKYIVIFMLSAGLILAIGNMLTNNDFLSTNIHKIEFYGFSLTILSIILAIIQSARSHDWNRRYTATTALLEIKDKLFPHTALIHEAFGYFDRKENSPIRVSEIHDKICLKDEAGAFIRHEETGRLKLDDDKKNIYRAIWETLNLYEYMASGFFQGVYDKAIVADLMASNIIKVASVFSEYIEHVNDEMYPRRGGKTWENIKTLGADFKREYRKDAAIQPRGNT